MVGSVMDFMGKSEAASAEAKYQSAVAQSYADAKAATAASSERALEEGYAANQLKRVQQEASAGQQKQQADIQVNRQAGTLEAANLASGISTSLIEREFWRQRDVYENGINQQVKFDAQSIDLANDSMRTKAAASTDTMANYVPKSVASPSLMGLGFGLAGAVAGGADKMNYSGSTKLTEGWTGLTNALKGAFSWGK